MPSRLGNGVNTPPSYFGPRGFNFSRVVNPDSAEVITYLTCDSYRESADADDVTCDEGSA
jgi:hypothetical protein